MEKNILEAIKKFSLLEKASTVTVALSGGADSMALLHALLSLSEKLNITVKAAHLNHMIRGEEALRDENFVKESCKALGVELFCERANVPEYARKRGISTELAAREIRYSFLERINQGVIATAHTASDNLETVLFNLARGTAIDGLCGIPPKRGIFIRPVILCTREQIEDYCHHNNISYVTDSTNLSDQYTRNKIRHQIIPHLKEINPSVENSVLRTTGLLREDSLFLESVADGFLSCNVSDGCLNLSEFEKLHPPIAKRVIKKFIETEKSNITLENIHVEEVYGALYKNCKISLPQNRSAVITKDKLRVVNNGESTQRKEEYIVNITGIEASNFKKDKKINNLLLNNSLDCDKIMGKSVLRTRLPGDSIRLRNRGCTKTLNRLFSENGVPLCERDNLPVLADDKGVIWVYGFGCAQRCAVTEATERIFIIEAEKQKDV